MGPIKVSRNDSRILAIMRLKAHSQGENGSWRGKMVPGTISLVEPFPWNHFPHFLGTISLFSVLRRPF